MDLTEIFDRYERKMYQSLFRSMMYGDNKEASNTARKIVDYERVFQII